MKDYKGRVIAWGRGTVHSKLTLSIDQFKYPAVQRYLHDLTGEMGEHLDSITSSLSIFIEIGPSSHDHLLFVIAMW